jgi:hypothetical protein
VSSLAKTVIIGPINKYNRTIFIHLHFEIAKMASNEKWPSDDHANISQHGNEKIEFQKISYLCNQTT